MSVAKAPKRVQHAGSLIDPKSGPGLRLLVTTDPERRIALLDELASQATEPVVLIRRFVTQGEGEPLAALRQQLLLRFDGAGDSPDAQTADGACASLNAYAAALGHIEQPETELGRMHARRRSLVDERQRILAGRSAALDYHRRRLQALETLEHLESIRAVCEADAQQLARRERARRLEEAEGIADRINQLTMQSFEQGDLRNFPLDEVAETQRLATLADSARELLAQTEAELAEVRAEIEKEEERLGADAKLAVEELEPTYESRLTEFESRINRLIDRLDEARKARDRAKRRQEDARREIEELPTYQDVPGDPVQWLTQLAGAFNTAQQARSEETSKRQRLETSVEHLREKISKPAEVFCEVDDFYELARGYAVRTREHDETLKELQWEADLNRRRADELNNKVPGFWFFTLLSAAGAIGLIIWAVMTQNPGIFIPVLFALGMFLFSVFSVVLNRRGTNAAIERNAHIEVERDAVRMADREDRRTIESLLHRAQCETVRELEAYYDRYRQDCLELSVLEGQLQSQASAAAAAAQRVAVEFRSLKEALSLVGESLDSEEAVQSATMNAIGRYQTYRDAKRRVGESRQAIERRTQEVDELEQALAAEQKQELELALEVRQRLRDLGYQEELKFDSALRALQGYRIRSAQLRQKRRQFEALRTKANVIEERLAAERETVQKRLAGLQLVLKATHCETLETYMERAERARRYRGQWRERADLEERLEDLLGGNTLATLRKQVVDESRMDDDDTPRNPGGAARAEEVRAQVESLRNEVARLHEEAARATSGLRTLNEVEEELAQVEAELERLHRESEAAQRAADVLADTAYERRMRLAGPLAEIGSAYFRELTGGVFQGVEISESFEINLVHKSDIGNARLDDLALSRLHLALHLALAEAEAVEGPARLILLEEPFPGDAPLEPELDVFVQAAERRPVVCLTGRAELAAIAKKRKLPLVTV